jgi:hypothetical protein
MRYSNKEQVLTAFVASNDSQQKRANQSLKPALNIFSALPT